MSESSQVMPPELLGSMAFRKAYSVRYAYVSGSMYRGIASPALVIRMGRAGLMAYFGTGGLSLSEMEAGIALIQQQLNSGQSFGANLIANLERPEQEMQTVNLLLERGVRFVEASAFAKITPALVKYRLKGARRSGVRSAFVPNSVLAKVSHPKVAKEFMEPASREIVVDLLQRGEISEEEAGVAELVPVAQDICVESDSAGHTDRGNPYVLFPAMLSLRDRVSSEHSYPEPIRIGAAGGIGTPEAAAAAFVLGADFVLTGSVNQCTVEAGTSEAVKDILQCLDIHDTDYAPAGDMFELGAQVQVVKRGLFFPARARRLYELYQRCASLDEIDEGQKREIEDKFFGRSFDDVWAEARARFERVFPEKVASIERNPKRKMAAVFRWYFGHTSRIAIEGIGSRRVNFQIHCGPALGAFNQWVNGTDLENWRDRHVDEIAERIMREAAILVGNRLSAYSRVSADEYSEAV